ncbi:MAG: OmpA family protein [Alphaproteobacteria bacterium]|nr:OmpA family protein [Alphaproteobacteria bacterium]
MTSETEVDAWAPERRESYYASITDMLIGLLFLFIIMLMYFALQLRTTTEDLVTAEETRNELLEKVAGYLRSRDVRAEIDLSAGVLRLPDEILFEKGRDEPKAEGGAALRILAEAMTVNLPCYAYQLSSPRPAECSSYPHHVEAIFIEGHTDSDPIEGNARIRDNWDLSAARASNTFRLISRYQPGLLAFLTEPAGSEEARPLLSVAGYGDQRPVDRGSGEDAKSRNRRIDIRFVMAAPKASATAADPPTQ